MIDGETESRLAIAIRIEDPVLAQRIAAALAAAPGLRVAAAGEPADFALVEESEEEAEASVDGEALFTPRERQVLALMAEGASNKEIAARLGISVHTAKFHVGQLLDKLDAVGRTDAVAQAARIGVLHL